MTRLSSVPVLCTLWSFCLSVISAKMVSLTARHGQPSGPNGKYTYDAQLSDVRTYHCLCVYLRVLGGIPKKSERQHQPGGGWRWASYTTHPRGRCCFYFQTCQSSPCLGDQKPSLTNKPVSVWRVNHWPQVSATSTFNPNLFTPALGCRSCVYSSRRRDEVLLSHLQLVAPEDLELSTTLGKMMTLWLVDPL